MFRGLHLQWRWVWVRAPGLRDRSSSFRLLSSPGIALRIQIKGETRCVSGFCQKKKKSIIFEARRNRALVFKRVLRDHLRSCFPAIVSFGSNKLIKILKKKKMCLYTGVSHDR